MEKNKEDLIKETKSLVDIYLKELCNSDRTPYLCELRDSMDGLNQIYNHIIKVCSTLNITISDALYDYEINLDPNRNND